MPPKRLNETQNLQTNDNQCSGGKSAMTINSMNHYSLFFCMLAGFLLSPMLNGQESAPADKPATEIKDLTRQERRELQFALSQMHDKSRRSYAEAVLTKFAPLDQPGIFEAHEALVKIDFAKRETRAQSNSEVRYVPDFEFLDKHLDHMRAQRPDSSVIELTEKRYEYETRFHYSQALNVANKAWTADPLEFKHLIYYYERIAKRDIPRFYLEKIESKLEQLVEEALQEPEVEQEVVVRGRRTKKGPTPRQKRLLAAVRTYYGSYDPDKGIQLLERLKEHPNYSNYCAPLLAELNLEKLKSLAEKGAVKSIDGEDLIYAKTAEAREAQLEYMKVALGTKWGKLKRQHPGVNKLLIDFIFEGGEYADRARQIDDPTRDIEGRPSRIQRDMRAYIARKYFEIGEYDKVLDWGHRQRGTRNETLAIWCIANVKSEKGDPKLALDYIKDHNLEVDSWGNQNLKGQLDPQMVKAKGMLLVENGHSLMAFDLLKYYCAKFPNDEDAKEYLSKCNANIRADVK